MLDARHGCRGIQLREELSSVRSYSPGNAGASSSSDTASDKERGCDAPAQYYSPVSLLQPSCGPDTEMKSWGGVSLDPGSGGR